MGRTRSLADLSSIVTTNLSNGFVGIGSTIPNQKLDIIGITTIGTGSTISFTTGPSDIGSAESVKDINGTFSLNLTGNITASGFIGDGDKLSGIGATAFSKIIDQKAYNVHGGTFTSGAWRTRDLNTILFDGDLIGNSTGAIGVTLNNNAFTLPSGTYAIDYSVPSFRVQRTSCRLYNVTDSEVVGGGTTIIPNSCMFYYNNFIASHRVVGVSPKITLASSTEFRVEHQCSNTVSSYGFGYSGPASDWGNSYYTVINIYKF